MHCNGFAGDADTVVEALAARPKVLGGTLPFISSIYVHSQGRDYHFHSFQIRNPPAPGEFLEKKSKHYRPIPDP